MAKKAKAKARKSVKTKEEETPSSDLEKRKENQRNALLHLEVLASKNTSQKDECPRVQNSNENLWLHEVKKKRGRI